MGRFSLSSLNPVSLVKGGWSSKTGAAMLLGGSPAALYQQSKDQQERANILANATAEERAAIAAASGRVGADGSYNPLIMSGGAHAASDTLANVTRAKYDDWKARFFPKVGELMDMTTYNNPNLIAQETAGAVNTVNESFNLANGSQARNVASYGMTQVPDDTRANDLGQVASQVDAINNTRLVLKDRDRAIAAGGLGTQGGAA